MYKGHLLRRGFQETGKLETKTTKIHYVNRRTCQIVFKKMKVKSCMRQQTDPEGRKLWLADFAVEKKINKKAGAAPTPKGLCPPSPLLCPSPHMYLPAPGFLPLSCHTCYPSQPHRPSEPLSSLSLSSLVMDWKSKRGRYQAPSVPLEDILPNT